MILQPSRIHSAAFMQCSFAKAQSTTHCNLFKDSPAKLHFRIMESYKPGGIPFKKNKPGGKGWKGKTAYVLSQPKVSKFDFTIRAHEYVSSFYISAKKSTGMK